MPLIIKTAGFEDFLGKNGGAYLKALIMGDHGVGKTPFAAQWPKPVIADCEKGILSVASLGTQYAPITSSADMDALLDEIRRECLKPTEKRRWETLVIDTIDSYQRKLIQERLKAERKESLSGWADWGWLDGKMIALIERLLALPMNVVVNMHTKDISEEDGDNSILVQKARLKGDIKDAIFQDFDLIGHMEQSYVAGTGEKKGERVRVRQIRWHSEPKYPALRDRSNKLPRFTDVTFTAEDYWRIFNSITEGLDDIPKSEEVATLAVEGDDATPPPADEVGGPVEAPTLPAAKKAPAAKKTAAKKAPAKKAATTPSGAEATDVPTSTEDQAAGEVDPWTGKPATPASTSSATEVATDVPTSDPELAAAADQVEPAGDQAAAEVATPVEDPEALVASELGATVVEEEPPAPEPTPEPVKPAEQPRTAKYCGEQPASMVGKFDAVPGCGIELSADNAGKAQIAVMKFRTYLCNEDFAKQQAAAS